MADNVVANAGSGGATFATDDVAGVHYPYCKLAYGAADTATIVSATAGLPVTIISGQGSGITGGAGAVAAGTPRVTLGSDDPAVVSLGVMDDWDETNRCAVNLIAGQVGVAGGSGTVGATTQRVVLATDVGLPAGTSLLGRASASLETGTVYDGTTALTPKFAVIDHATSGNNTLVAAVASKKVRVLAAMLIAGGTVNVRFESGADGTALSGQMQLTAQTGFTLPFNPVGWFETAAATLLNLELSAAVSVDGMLVYVEV